MKKTILTGVALCAFAAVSMAADAIKVRADLVALNGANLTNLNASSLASGTVPNARLDAELSLLATNKAVISRTGSNLQLDYGATTNLGTVTWTTVFAGTPSVTAGYWGNGLTNLHGGYAAAQVKTADATNCVVVGDAVDTAQYIYVIAVGVAP